MLRVAAGLVHHRHGVMAAHVEECAKHVIRAAHDNDRLVRDGRRHVVARLRDLILPSHRLPLSRENVLQFQIRDALVGVPRRGDRVCLRERRIRVIRAEDLFQRELHRAISWMN